jgi:hypothetical protein
MKPNLTNKIPQHFIALTTKQAAEFGVEVVLAATALHLASKNPNTTAAVIETLETSNIPTITHTNSNQLKTTIPPPDVDETPELLGVIRQAAPQPKPCMRLRPKQIGDKR